MKQFYVGIDLHAKSSQICVIGGEGEKLAEAGLRNDLPVILDFLSPLPGQVYLLQILKSQDRFALMTEQAFT